MDNSAANTDLIRSHVITIILRSLQGNDKYGYEICREIEVKSEGSYVLKQPTLYSCLKRLESQGYITSYMGDISNGGRRRYYSLTEKGEEFLERDKQEWEFSRTLINRLLSDKDYDLTQPPPFNPSDLRPYTRKITTFQTSEELASGSLDEDTILSQQSIEEQTTHKVTPTTIDSSTESIEDEESCELQDAEEDAVSTKVEEDEDVPEKVSFISPLFYEEASEETEEDTTKFRTLDDIFGTQTIEAVSTAQSTEPIIESVQQEVAPEQIVEDVVKEVFDPTPASVTDEGQKDDVNYRSAFSKLFDVEPEPPAPTAQKVEMEAKPVEDSVQSTPTVSDLKKRYYAEGYNLKQYSRSNVSIFYNMNYVYSNKLNTLTYWIMYAFILVEIGLVALFESSLNLGLATYLTAIFVALIIPGVPTIMTLLNPLKRIKANFELKRSVINRLLLFLNLSLIVACLGLFVWQVDLNNLATMIKPILLPILFLLNLPLSSVVYYQIYKTKKFHLS